jgi:hypothetical protein
MRYPKSVVVIRTAELERSVVERPARSVVPLVLTVGIAIARPRHLLAVLMIVKLPHVSLRTVLAKR